MKNKGFTLIELIASIAILAMLSTIIVVAVSKSINKAKEDANATMLKAIRLAAEDYAVNNEGILTDFSTNDWVDIKLETLIKNNYFDNELKDFVTKENIPITNFVRVTRSTTGKVTTTYNENQTTQTTISLNGSYNTYIKKGDTYIDEGVIATTPEGVNVTSSVVKTGTVDTNTLGTYVITYTYQDVSITRNVIVSETDNLVSTWHTITVNPNGGTYSGSTGNTIYSIKEGRTQTIAIPTKPDFTFTSWTRTCTACYNTTTRVYTMGTANDTLTAGWQQNPNINLTVNLNGGSTTQTFNATYPINSTLALTTPTKSGSVFSHWTATGASVSGSTLTIGTSSITLTANFYTYATMFTYTGSSTVIDDGSGNWRIKFLTSGTFTPLVNMNVNMFVVGGGGGGGVSCSGYLGGGGGSAGYSASNLSSTALTANTAYAVVVGAGGASNTNGGQSYFISTSYSAGGGNKGSGSTGASGGAGAGGGGGYSNDYVAGTGGSYGGNAIPGGSRSAAGGTGQGWSSCEFGQGTLTSCNAGVTAYGGGGSGGAGKNYGGTAGPSIAGGYIGGGRGGSNGVGGNGVANTGGGGGGGGYCNFAGGVGGSGIVIIRNHR